MYLSTSKMWFFRMDLTYSFHPNWDFGRAKLKVKWGRKNCACAGNVSVISGRMDSSGEPNFNYRRNSSEQCHFLTTVLSSIIMFELEKEKIDNTDFTISAWTMHVILPAFSLFLLLCLLCLPYCWPLPNWSCTLLIRVALEANVVRDTPRLSFRVVRNIIQLLPWIILPFSIWEEWIWESLLLQVSG